MTRNDFHSEWLAHFAKGIPKREIDQYVVSTGNYLWHVFSWALLDKHSFLVGADAKSAFDRIDKNNAIYFEWFKDDFPKKLPDTITTADDLDRMTEVYVVSSDFSWTYIKTHESMCGPYFMNLSLPR